ncbi:hypothetical protein LOTGIDRAFT_237661 [Lottia gigantea]|uniref:Calcineurin-like phosphoesterase domain-containing protein n=1 Tax=Lottia gigantea TaxID=225164 RepID=V4BBX4_LOTGI|nr:hypothetical protein LOTGIDRAFT_237661 [Lottia gigantea]ESP03562.1 hypothetical protein LOTGIDRAFT_237661 [Lottia gigantea]
MKSKMDVYYYRKVKNKMVCVLLVIVMCLLLYNECVVFWYQQLIWPPLPENSDRNLVVLLVADPQIQGEYLEPMFPIGSISRWDADRYLKKTFERVYLYSQPDIVMFLGDLMDEGDQATHEQYDTYYNRFMDIFQLAKQSKVQFIAGDNDIGGEKIHKRIPDKVNRFERYFQPTYGSTQVSFLDIIKFDYWLYSKWGTAPLLANMRNKSSSFKMVITHESILKTNNNKMQLIRDIKPDVIISAHMHQSMQYEGNLRFGDMQVNSIKLNQINTFINVNVSNPTSVNEVMVPTCSYRMGEPRMGYGLAVLSDDKTMKYTVLWSPSRYRSLRLYIYVVIIIFLFYNFKKWYQAWVNCKTYF